MSSVAVPVEELDGQKWLLLNRVLDRKIVIQASAIDSPKRITGPHNQHHVFETVAEGGVRARAKRYVIL